MSDTDKKEGFAHSVDFAEIKTRQETKRRDQEKRSSPKKALQRIRSTRGPGIHEMPRARIAPEKMNLKVSSFRRMDDSFAETDNVVAMRFHKYAKEPYYYLSFANGVCMMNDESVHRGYVFHPSRRDDMLRIFTKFYSVYFRKSFGLKDFEAMFERCCREADAL